MIIFDMKAVGNRLYSFRKQSGLTQEELAEKSNMSLRTYADIERGCVNMRVETVLRICDVLHITPNDIFIDENDDTVPTESELAQQFEKLSSQNKKTALKLLGVYLNSIK